MWLDSAVTARHDLQLPACSNPSSQGCVRDVRAADQWGHWNSSCQIHSTSISSLFCHWAFSSASHSLKTWLRCLQSVEKKKKWWSCMNSSLFLFLSWLCFIVSRRREHFLNSHSRLNENFSKQTQSVPYYILLSCCWNGMQTRLDNTKATRLISLQCLEMAKCSNFPLYSIVLRPTNPFSWTLTNCINVKLPLAAKFSPFLFSTALSLFHTWK